MSLLLIDNYDSFVHNLARYLRRLGQVVTVRRNDEIDLDRIAAAPPQAILISPGPCAPGQAGLSLATVRKFYQQIPIFGVCLGHQVIGEALGAKVVAAPRPIHGRVSPIVHQQQGIFAGLPSPLDAARYHSLVISRHELPGQLAVIAHAQDDDTIMAIQHRDYLVCGVQFHPESILTNWGFRLLANFLELAKLPVTPQAAQLFATELANSPPSQPTNANPQLKLPYPLPYKQTR